jgi:hypothetical protein
MLVDARPGQLGRAPRRWETPKMYVASDFRLPPCCFALVMAAHFAVGHKAA